MTAPCLSTPTPWNYARMLRQAVNSFYMDRESGAEAAQRLDCAETTVRKRLQRAREQLGPCIEENLAK